MDEKLTVVLLADGAGSSASSVFASLCCLPWTV